MENEEEKFVSEPEPGPVEDRWTINHSKCNTCCDCVDVCPIGLLYFDEKSKLISINHEESCTHCADCASVCAYGAIVIT